VVERGNAKHSPREDDMLAAELSGSLGPHGSNREEWIDPEPPADDDAPARLGPPVEERPVAARTPRHLTMPTRRTTSTSRTTGTPSTADDQPAAPVTLGASRGRFICVRTAMMDDEHPPSWTSTRWIDTKVWPEETFEP
jgi:hypothetical protein